MHAYDGRPLGVHSLWESEVCPFNLAPRWLTSPSEVSTNFVSASSAWSRSKSLRHTVKLFGTVKARAVVICISHAHSYHTCFSGPPERAIDMGSRLVPDFEW